MITRPRQSLTLKPVDGFVQLVKLMKPNSLLHRIHPSKYILQTTCHQGYLCGKYRDMRYDTKQIQKWLKAWEQSGMSIGKYCEDKPFDKSTFYNWRKKLTEPSITKQSNKFVPLQVTALSIPLMSIHYPNGVRLDVHMGLSSDEIRTLAGC